MSTPAPLTFLRAPIVALAFALVASSAQPRIASAKDEATGPPWLKLDRVEAEPSWMRGIARLRVYVSAIELNGGTIGIFGKKAWTLKIGGAKKKAPYIAGHFKAMDDDLAIVFVLQVTSDYKEHLPEIKEAVKAFIESLPKDAQVGITTYAEDVDADRRLSNKKKALGRLEDIEAEYSTDTELIKAVDKASRALRRAKPSSPGKPMRKLIVVIGDGRDIEHDKDRFRRSAKKANRYDARIHTIAFSADNVRKWMLGLGELSKQTHGTFRLIRSELIDFAKPLQHLREEIDDQYVLTYYLPSEEIKGKKLRVLARDLVSNDIKLKDVTCGKDACESDQYCVNHECVTRKTEEGSGILGWLLYIIGGGVGLLAILIGVGYVLTRRHEKKAAAAALAQAAEEAAEAQTSHRIVPQGPEGGRVEPAQPRGAHQPRAPQQQQQFGRVQPIGGAVQPQAAPQPRAPRPPAKAAGPGIINVLKGPHAGESFTVTNGFSVGKAPDNALCIAGDNFASSHHAMFQVDKGGNCTLVDKGSTNGTFVNGVRTAQTRLVSGMIIRIGSTEMRFTQG